MTNISVHSGSSTQHSRDFYKGTSFRYSGEWTSGVHYVCDEYVVDFVVYNNALLRCKRSHLSTSTNKPDNFITDETGSIIGIISENWDLVLSGRKGETPSITFDEHGNIYVNNVKVINIFDDLGIYSKSEIDEMFDDIDIDLNYATTEDILALFYGSSINDIINHIIILGGDNYIDNDMMVFVDNTTVYNNILNLA